MAIPTLPSRKLGGNIRPIRIDGPFAFIPLTKGFEAKIDIADVGIAEGRNWSACIVGKAKKRVYAVVGVKPATGGKTRLVYLHRLLCLGKTVDHIDRDTLNNSRANLRSCSLAENNRNVAAMSRSKSGIKGVFPDNRRGGYRSCLRLNGKTVFQGHFETVDEATAAYDAAARMHHGEFAYINTQSE